MSAEKSCNKRLETLAWGLLLVWWGFVALADFLPHGAGWIGSGLILIGLNVVRSWAGIRVNGFSFSLGLIVFAIGGSALAREGTGPSPLLSGLAVVLIGLGAFMLASAIRRFPERTE